jgi:hypothetical protein
MELEYHLSLSSMMTANDQTLGVDRSCWWPSLVDVCDLASFRHCCQRSGDHNVKGSITMSKGRSRCQRVDQNVKGSIIIQRIDQKTPPRCENNTGANGRKVHLTR